jgi:membrane associated rhomboid family serine protease
MISAAVGFQCPECVATGARETRQHVGPFGGRISTNPALTSIILIVMNAAVWVAITLTGGRTSSLAQLLSITPIGQCWSSSQPGSYYPEVHTAAICQTVSDGAWMPGVADGAWWQLITSGFTHIDILHIGMNMLALWFLGPPVERAIGRARFLAIYLISLLAASVSVMFFAAPTTTTMGASGAIFGLIGALLLLTLKVGGDFRGVLFWLVINVAFTFTGSGISWQGHLGGLVGGLAASAIVLFAPRKDRVPLQWAGLATLTLLLGLLAAFRIIQLG